MEKVFSFNSELDKVTGVQKVLMDIHVAVKEEYSTKIVGTIPFNKVNKVHGINKEEYIKFHNPFMFYHSIVVLHERKYLILFWILNHFLFQKIKLVYVHHNVFHDHRRMSIMPHIVVAISEEGVENLKTFFNVPVCNIHKIYNCVKDINPKSHNYYVNENIKILYPARINGVKRQLDIVKHLKGKISDRIKILFAGTGPQAIELEKEVKTDHSFEFLGYRSNIYQLLKSCDYVMLFSKQEGLPISLIESIMVGTPVICNNIGGNSEIVHNEENGFVFNIDDWDSLINQLNILPQISKDKYVEMSKACRNIYKKDFTFEKFKQKYLELFNNL
jgi:glycosyltransferase involved in cell wall biosynthesis